MANQEQVERLLQDITEWNKWRKENPRTNIDLSKADLREAKLLKANLRNVNLRYANLTNANLEGASLLGASLRMANLSMANLVGASFRRAWLGATNLTGVILGRTDFWEAGLLSTNLINLDLTDARGLEEVIHGGPSHISTTTLERSGANIPEKFLRGCGLKDWEIESAKLYKPRLSSREVNNIVSRICELRSTRAEQISPLFISYNHEDNTFVDELEKYLNEKGIRFWRDIHDAMAGRLEKVIDQAIQQNPIVLLILSKNSVKSDWVQHEARSARELELKLDRDVLCPVALDDAWKDCAWPARLREQIMEYNILDFSQWKDERKFGRMFKRLIDGLDLFYKEG
jgi:hypothetical protein